MPVQLPLLAGNKCPCFYRRLVNSFARIEAGGITLHAAAKFPVRALKSTYPVPKPPSGVPPVDAIAHKVDETHNAMMALACAVRGCNITPHL
jgi:hypothetical protein